MGGLQFMAAILLEKSYSLRLHKKLLFLMHDFAINDENIFEETPSMVRKTFGEQMDILPTLISMLLEAGTE
jgi:hypothetical protein